VPPPRRSLGTRRGHEPIPTRHLGARADCHPEGRRPEGPHSFRSGVLRFAQDHGSLLPTRRGWRVPRSRFDLTLEIKDRHAETRPLGDPSWATAVFSVK
jgi:hypothetical protein